MSPKSEPNLTGHNYDGIEEYDNPTPGWWTWIFICTVMFAAMYFFFITLAGGALSPLGDYEREVTADQERQFTAMGEINSDPASLIKMSQDPKLINVGRAMFITNCAACHALNGSGLTGPNLTDNYYINVKKIGDFIDVISKGRNNGAMPAWENRLRPKEITLLSAYVASLRGGNLPGPLGKQGEEIAPLSAN